MHTHGCVVLGFKTMMSKMLAIGLTLCLGVVPVLPKDNDIAVPPGNWCAVEHLPQGTKISVHMTFGDRIDGRFLSLDVESIRLTSDGQDRIYPRRDVAEIWQLRVPDKKLNGILVGMGAGATAGIIAAYAVETGGGNRWRQEDAPGPYFLLAGLGLGALLGGIVDASIRGDQLLYRAR